MNNTHLQETTNCDTMSDSKYVDIEAIEDRKTYRALLSAYHGIMKAMARLERKHGFKRPKDKVES